MEYYSAMKKKDILPFVTTWMELQDIMLSEISQTEKDKYHSVSHMESKKTKITETETRKVVTRGLGWGHWGQERKK